MADTLGQMRARVRLYAPARSEDDLGGAPRAWTDEGAAWAWIAPVSASETSAFDRADPIARYRVTLRARADVRGGWRLVWGARAFRIVSVLDEANALQTLICEEELT